MIFCVVSVIYRCFARLEMLFVGSNDSSVKPFVNTLFQLKLN